MNIVKNSCGEEDVEKGFQEGNVVFKIIARTSEKEYDIGMVTTSDDYKKRISTHAYQPILYLLNLPTRLAYLYNCLNHAYQKPRKEEYVFLWRKIGEDIWKEWFIVRRYLDTDFGERPRLLDH